VSNWIDIPDSSIDAESEVRDFPLGTAPHNILHQMRENNLALFRDGHADAPRIKAGAFADDTIHGDKLVAASVTSASIKPDSVPNAALANDCVNQSKMSFLNSNLSWNLYDTGGRVMVNPAGPYQLGYYSSWGVAPGTAYYRLGFPGSQITSGIGTPGLHSYSPEAVTQMATFTAYVWCLTNLAVPTATKIVNVRILSPSASPPYSLGHGDIPAFIFADVDSDGNMDAIYASGEPPWAYNGPTNIIPHKSLRDGRRFRYEPRLPFSLAEARRHPARMAALVEALRSPVYEEIEITREYKNRDMGLIPHPFPSPSGNAIVLLDPLSPVVGKIHDLMQCGDFSADEVRQYVRIGNDAIAGHNSPAGVMTVRADWK
jgi:hypothetical protein